MSTGYGWEGLRQVCATLLGARHDLSASVVALSTYGCYNKLTFNLSYLTLRHALVFVKRLIFSIVTSDYASLQKVSFWKLLLHSFMGSMPFCHPVNSVRVLKDNNVNYPTDKPVGD